MVESPHPQPFPQKGEGSLSIQKMMSIQ